MGGKAAVRVTIDVSGKPRSVLSLNEEKDGTIYLHLKPARYSRENSIKHKISGEFLTNKYSLHLNPRDPTGNTFHLTIRTSNQRPKEKTEAHHFTRAIKSYARFAPVFVRRLPHLDSPEFSLSAANRELLSLGSMLPEKQTIFIGVAAGPTGRELKRLDPLKDVSHVQCHFSFFSLIVFWWFLDIPSHYSGDSLHPMTTRHTEKLTQDQRWSEKDLTDGYNDMELVAYFSHYGEMLARRYVDFLNANDPSAKSLSATHKLLHPIIGLPEEPPPMPPIDVALIRKITRGE